MASGRVACPVDPSHTVKLSKLEQHVRICNATKHSNEQSAQPWYEQGVNSGTNQGCGVATTDELAPFVDEIDVESELAYVDTEEDSRAGGDRHDAQGDRIVATVDVEGAAFVDMGAGRGCLAAAARRLRPECAVVVVERSAPRFKFDSLLRRQGRFERIRCDLRHLDLDKIDFLRGESNVVGVAKHLCGSATDLALRALVRSPSTTAIAIATCCHHRCDWRDYVGTPSDLIQEDFTSTSPAAALFAAASKYSSWFSSPLEQENHHRAGGNQVDRSAGDQMKKMTRPDETAREEKRLFGRRCKRLIDRGRVRYLERNGFHAELRPYCCASSLSPENVVLVATRMRCIDPEP